MKCSNCNEERESVFELLPERGYNACPECSVAIAIKRNGTVLAIYDEVTLNGYHPKTEGRIFIIKGIYKFENCESGTMIYLIDKETERPLKSVLDANWLLKNKT